MPYKDPEKKRQKNREQRERYKAEGRKWPRSPDWSRNYYWANRERILSQRKKRDAENPEKAREAKRRWNEDNHDKIIEQRRIYRETHREHLREMFREWSAKSPKLEAWYERNADKVKESKRNSARRRYHRYRESFMEWMNTAAPRKVALLLKWQLCGEVCYICGLPLKQEDIEADHIHPRAKGGGNGIDNLMPAHKVCNRKKQHRVDYPIVRPDLIYLVAHVCAVPRNVNAIKRRPERWLTSKTRNQMIEEGKIMIEGGGRG